MIVYTFEGLHTLVSKSSTTIMLLALIMIYDANMFATERGRQLPHSNKWLQPLRFLCEVEFPCAYIYSPGLKELYTIV